MNSKLLLHSILLIGFGSFIPTVMASTIVGRGISFCGVYDGSLSQPNSYSIERSGVGVTRFVENNLGLYGLRHQFQICSGKQVLKRQYFSSDAEEFLDPSLHPFKHDGVFVHMEYFPVISEALPVGMINYFFLGAPTIYAGAGFSLGMDYSEIKDFDETTDMMTIEEFTLLKKEREGFRANIGPMIKVGVELRLIFAVNLELNLGYAINSEGNLVPTGKVLMNLLLLED